MSEWIKRVCKKCGNDTFNIYDDEYFTLKEIIEQTEKQRKELMKQ
jgi:hypothetical protein